MKQPLISVVVAIYNVAQYLPRAVESVISQSIGFENIQLLLCDDCSTDGSYALAQQYAAGEQSDEDALFVLQQLHRMHAERQLELGNIFFSGTWRLAALLQKLLFWKKG